MNSMWKEHMKSKLELVIEEAKKEFKVIGSKSKDIVLKIGKELEKTQGRPEDICEEIKNILNEEIAQGLISRRNIERYCPDNWKKKRRPKKQGVNDNLSLSAGKKSLPPMVIDTEGKTISEARDIDDDIDDNHSNPNSGLKIEEIEIDDIDLMFHITSIGRRIPDLLETNRDVFKVLELTQAGKNFLDQYNKNNPSIPICRAENIQFKAPIIKMPTIAVDWKKIQMHNWTQYTSQIDSVKVRLNMGKNPTIEVIPSPIDGDDPFELYIILVYECINVIQSLNDRIGLLVGKLELSSRGEWVTYDPIARSFCKTNGQVTYNGIAKVNASKPREIGEFEFHDPRALIDYLTMPKRLKRIEEMLEKYLHVNN